MSDAALNKALALVCPPKARQAQANRCGPVRMLPLHEITLRHGVLWIYSQVRNGIVDLEGRSPLYQFSQVWIYAVSRPSRSPWD